MSSEDSKIKYILPNNTYWEAITNETTGKMFIPRTDEVISLRTSRKNSITLPVYFGVLYGLL